jgi:hypothetical protein
MRDRSMIEPVAATIAHRLIDRFEYLLRDRAEFERRLVELDGQLLIHLLRQLGDSCAPPPAPRRHLGVVGVDHALSRLVVEGAAGGRGLAGRLGAIDLEELDDEDLIAAAYYLPETLPGAMLG